MIVCRMSGLSGLLMHFYLLLVICAFLSRFFFALTRPRSLWNSAGSMTSRTCSFSLERSPHSGISLDFGALVTPRVTCFMGLFSMGGYGRILTS